MALSPPPWNCAACTLRHSGSEALFLVCTACGAERRVAGEEGPIQLEVLEADAALKSRHPPPAEQEAPIQLEAPEAGAALKSQRPPPAGQEAEVAPAAERQLGPEVQLEAHEHETLPGQFTAADFVTEEEEAQLLAFLDDDQGGTLPWAAGFYDGPPMAKRPDVERLLKKRWGVKVDLKANKFLPADRPLPAIFAPLIRRLRALRLVPHASAGGAAAAGHAPAAGSAGPAPKRRRVGAGASLDEIQSLLREFRPNEANAIYYRRDLGHSLKDHVDHRSLSGALVINLSLAGSATMTYRPANFGRGGRPVAGAAEVRVELPRRSVQVQSGTVRFEYTHGIRLEDLPAEGRRVSVTFRQNVCGYGYFDEALLVEPGGPPAAQLAPAPAGAPARARTEAPIWKALRPREAPLEPITLDDDD